MEANTSYTPHTHAGLHNMQNPVVTNENEQLLMLQKQIQQIFHSSQTGKVSDIHTLKAELDLKLKTFQEIDINTLSIKDLKVFLLFLKQTIPSSLEYQKSIDILTLIDKTQAIEKGEIGFIETCLEVAPESLDLISQEILKKMPCDLLLSAIVRSQSPISKILKDKIVQHLNIHDMLRSQNLIKLVLENSDTDLLKSLVSKNQNNITSELHLITQETNGKLSKREVELLVDLVYHAIIEKLQSPCQGNTLFHYVQNMDQCKLLKQRGFQIDKANNKGDTPLILAVLDGRPEVAKTLIELGADVTVKASNERTLLHLVHDSAAKICEMLIVKGLILDALDSAGDTPLILAVANGRPEVAKTLIEVGANVSIKTRKGRTLLHLVHNSAAQMCKLLIEQGLTLDAIDSAGHAPLMLAVASGRPEVAKTLIELGASVTVKDSSERTLLHYIHDSAAQMCKMLIEQGLTLDAIDRAGDTPLILAVADGRPEVAKTLVEVGANVLIKTRKGRTLLHLVHNSAAQMCKMLIEQGLTLDAIDSARHTPLMLAVASGSPEVAKTLIELGASVTVKDSNERTLLHYIHDSAAQMCKMLLEQGVTLDAIDRAGDTPLILAVADGRPEVAKTLIELGANVLIKTRKGRTLLHYIHNSAAQMCKLLIEQGLTLDATDRAGDTPLILAVFNGRPEVAKTLIELGANVLVKIANERTLLHIVHDSAAKICEILIKKGLSINSVDKDRNTPIMSAAAQSRWNVVKELIILGAYIDLNNTDGQLLLFLASDIELCKRFIQNIKIAKTNGKAQTESYDEEGVCKLLKLLLQKHSVERVQDIIDILKAKGLDTRKISIIINNQSIHSICQKLDHVVYEKSKLQPDVASEPLAVGESSEKIIDILHNGIVDFAASLECGITKIFLLQNLKSNLIRYLIATEPSQVSKAYSKKKTKLLSDISTLINTTQEALKHQYLVKTKETHNNISKICSLIKSKKYKPCAQELSQYFYIKYIHVELIKTFVNLYVVEKIYRDIYQLRGTDFANKKDPAVMQKIADYELLVNQLDKEFHQGIQFIKPLLEKYIPELRKLSFNSYFQAENRHALRQESNKLSLQNASLLQNEAMTNCLTLIEIFCESMNALSVGSPQVFNTFEKCVQFGKFSSQTNTETCNPYYDMQFKQSEKGVQSISEIDSNIIPLKSLLKFPTSCADVIKSDIITLVFNNLNKLKSNQVSLDALFDQKFMGLERKASVIDQKELLDIFKEQDSAKQTKPTQVKPNLSKTLEMDAETSNDNSFETNQGGGKEEVVYVINQDPIISAAMAMENVSISDPNIELAEEIEKLSFTESRKEKNEVLEIEDTNSNKPRFVPLNQLRATEEFNTPIELSYHVQSWSSDKPDAFTFWPTDYKTDKQKTEAILFHSYPLEVVKLVFAMGYIRKFYSEERQKWDDAYWCSGKIVDYSQPDEVTYNGAFEASIEHGKTTLTHRFFRPDASNTIGERSEDAQQSTTPKQVIRLTNGIKLSEFENSYEVDDTVRKIKYILLP